MKIYNNSNESVFVHATWVGDAGTIDTWSMAPHTDKVFRPGWPNKPVINDTPYAITFWDSKKKYTDNFLKGLALAGFGGVLSGLSGNNSTIEIFSEIYRLVGSDVLTAAFGGRGVVGLATNVFDDGGWAAYSGRGYACDVGCTSTPWEAPQDRKFKYAWSVDGNRQQSRLYYPGEAEKMASAYGTLHTTQQVVNGRFVDAYEDSGNDYRMVTRPAQNNTSQQWKIEPPLTIA